VLLDRDPEALLAIVVSLLVGLTFHEFSHAAVADQLGDHRPRALGRLSLNPVAHIDPIGALMFIIAGFGWAKPVPVNVYALRGGRSGMAFVAAAGPLANLLVATAFAVAYRVLDIVGVSGFTQGLTLNIVFFNVLLAIFNLIPIPPLDGYNVVWPFLPPRLAYTVQRYAPYGLIVLLLLVLLPGSPLRLLLRLAQPITSLLTGA
jgi:Zn-dependent protease